MPIIKSKTHKSKGAYRNVLHYIFREDAQFEDQDGKTLFIKKNITGRKGDIESLVQQFEENLEYRKVIRKDNVNLLHDIISFSPEDKSNITLNILKDIAREYMNKRAENGVFVATAHRDKEHIHLHIAGSPLQLKTGESIRMTKQEFSELQMHINAYQQEKYPELEQSFIGYGKSKEKIKKKTKPSRLEQIKNIRLNVTKERPKKNNSRKL